MDNKEYTYNFSIFNDVYRIAVVQIKARNASKLFQTRNQVTIFRNFAGIATVEFHYDYSYYFSHKINNAQLYGRHIFCRVEMLFPYTIRPTDT